MKKLLTLLLGAGLAFGAYAEPVTQEVTIDFNVSIWDDVAEDYVEMENQPDSQKTTISYENGVFTIENLLGIGVPLEFTMPMEASAYTDGDWTDGNFKSTNLYDAYGDGGLYFYKGGYLNATIDNYNGSNDSVEMEYPLTSNPIGVYYDKSNEETPFYIEFYVDGYVGDDYVSLETGFYMEDLAGIFASNEDPVEPTIIDFESVLLNGDPSFEEPIDLEDKPLGAGDLAIPFGGELALNEAVSSPVTIAYNGNVVASLTLTKANVSIWGDAGAMTDDVDSSMTADMKMTVVALDFGKALTDAGTYTVSFPEGILKFADGNILGAGTVTYTIEAQEPPAYEGELDAWVSNYSTDTYYPYECDATVNEDGSVTVTNFMNGRIDVNFTFDITQLQNADDEAAITSANGKTADFWLKDAEGNYPTYYLTSEEGDKISFQKAYVYLDGVSYVMRLDEAVYGYNTWVEFSTYSKVTDSDAQYLYVGFYMNLDYPVVVPETTGNTEAWIETPWSETENTFYSYNMDVIYNEDGSITTTNFMYSGADVTLTFDAEALRDSKKGYVGFTSINGSTDKYPYLLNANGKYVKAYAYNENGTKDTIEYPFFYNSSSYCCIGLYSEEEAAEYGHKAYIDLIVQGFVGDDYSDYYEVYFDIDVTLPAKPVEFADALMGSMPSNEEPIDLNEYPLGAGFLNIALGGELSLAEGAEAPVTLSYNGKEVASLTLTEESLVTLGNDDAGTLTDDDVDPGMTAGMAYTVVELDFGKEFILPGAYTVAFPEGILTYANGAILKAGTVNYTIEPATVPETTGDTEAWIETPWGDGTYYGYNMDVTKNEDGSYTTTNFMYSGADVTVTFDIDALKESADGTTGFTSINGNTGKYPNLKDENGTAAICHAYNENGLEETINKPYFFNLPQYSCAGLYSEEEAAEYGHNAYIYLMMSGYNANGSDSECYSVWFDIDIDLTSVPEPTIVEFADAIMGSMPSNEEPIDLDEYPLGAGFLNIAIGGELKLTEGAEAPVTIAYNGEEVASVTLTEENLVTLGNDDAGTLAESNDVDPGMTASAVYTVVELDFDKALTEAGEYTVTFPEGILAFADGNILGAGTVTYTIEEQATPDPEPEPTIVEFADALMGSMPSNEEPIDLDEYPLGAGFLNIAIGGELRLAEGAEAPVTIAYNGEEVASITLTEECLVTLGNDDAGTLAEGDDDVDPGMTASVVYTVVELDFDKALTEAGEYTVTFPEGIMVYTNGDILGAGTVTYTIEGQATPDPEPEPTIVEFADALMGSMPSNEEPIDLDEYHLGAGFLNIAIGGELRLAEGAEAPVTIAYNGEKVASITLTEECLVTLGNDDAGTLAEGDDVDPGMTANVVYTVVELDFGKALTEAGEYTVSFPEGIMVYTNGDILSAGTVTYTIEEKTPVVVVPETFGNTEAWIETPWSDGEYYGYNMDVTKNAPGNYTTTNFMYSGASVTVTFDIDELVNSKDGYVGFTSLNGSTEKYPYLQNAEGKYVDCYAYNVDGTMATIVTPYFFNWDEYSYVELYSEEEAEEYGHNAYLCFLIQGWNADGSDSDWYEVWFDIDVDLTETGIQSVTIGGDAEYYDLHGVRVANPDKGIYIMRQSNKTVKVAK